MTHRLTGTRVYRAWQGILTRCYNTRRPDFKNYGGRGITVCDRWLKFENFLADMGQPLPNQMIERVDNNGHYEPTNCRWAYRSEQAVNKRNNRKITFKNKTQTLSQWSRECGIGHATILFRLKQGWTIERALTTDPHAYHHKSARTTTAARRCHHQGSLR